MAVKSEPLFYAFNRGVLSPLGLTRIDLKRYALAAQKMVNWICRTLGSMMLRPGLAYVDGIYNNLQAVHIPFIFSIADTAIIELTNNLMRVRVNEQIITRVAVGTTITNPNFTTNLNGWTQNDEAGAISQWVSEGPSMALQGNNTARAGRSQVVTVASGDQGKEHALRIVIAKGYVNFRVGITGGDDSYIEDTVLTPGVHSLAFTPTGNFNIGIHASTVYPTLIEEVNIEAAGVMTLPTPWPASMLHALRWDQSADVVFIASDGTVQQQEIQRRGIRSWSLVTYYADDGPFMNQNLDASIILTASALTGDITLTSNRPFFEPGHAGAMFSLLSTNGASVVDVVAGNQQFSDPIEVTGVSANGGRNLTVIITGTWAGTIFLQYSAGAPGAWVNSGQTYTGNVNTIYADGYDNQDIFYRIGFTTGYSSGAATVTLGFSQPSNVAGIVRIDSVNTNESVNAHVLKPLSGLTFVAGEYAAGNIAFTLNPSNGDTIQLNGVTWTFVTSGATGAQTNIQGSLSSTMTQLATDLNASVNASLTVAGYVGTTTEIQVTYKTLGPAGNSYTMRSGSLNSTPSGPMLTGGANATTGVGTSLWAQSVWSPLNGWPSAVSLYEGRLWWLGNDYIIGSVSDAYASFDQTVVGDAGPIVRTLGQGPVSVIQWVLGLQRLLVGSDGAEFSIRSDALDDPLTPTNFNAKIPSTRGSAAVSGLKIDTNGVFVQRGDPATGNTSGTRLIQIAYQGLYAIIDYTTSDLSEFAPELVAVGINRLAVQRKIDTRIHCVLNDGTVAILVYDPVENEKGWLAVTTNGFVEDVFVMPGGVEDIVYYAVRRVINGQTVRYLEKWAMESECTGLPMAKNVDSHIVYTGSATTSIGGLSTLEGMSVCVWGWNTITPFTVTMPNGSINTVGRDMGVYTVHSGQISGLSAAVTNAVIGLSYTAQYQTVKLAQTLQGGTTIGQVKNIDHIGVVMQNAHCQGLLYGQNFNNLEPMPLVEDGGVLDENTVWSEYDAEQFEFPGEWNVDSRLCLQAASPRPVTLLAAVVDMETNVK